MSNTEVALVKPRSLAKGMIAGVVGGLAGAVAKTLAERLFPPHADTKQEAATEAIHWGFGAAVGTAYGALAEYYPTATAKEGASFGMALEALTQETALPVLGLSAEPSGDQTLRERASGITSYVVYGVTTEWVRKFIRKVL
jgi:putative membrane protein